MDGAGVWSKIRCAGSVRDTKIINRIMLRFRPIAPKPTAGGPLSGGSAIDNPNVLVSRRRTKRKYVRIRRRSNECNKGKGRTGVASEEATGSSAVALQLLPETCTERKDSSDGGSRCSKIDREVEEKQYQDDGNPFIRWNLTSDCTGVVDARSLHRTAMIPRKMRAGEAWVTVEYVRETCMDGRGLGCTDLERLTNLDGDTCPGFISDGLNRVLWVNGAFRKMLSEEGGDGEEHAPPEMELWLVTKERLPNKAFTCQVKVHTWGKKKYSSQMVPCDAWRMDGGGFAWRLDVKAALSLGR